MIVYVVIFVNPQIFTLQIIYSLIRTNMTIRILKILGLFQGINENFILRRFV